MIRTLQEQLATETQKHYAGEQERRIRNDWYRDSAEIVRVLRKTLSLLPSPQHTHAFETDDWQRLQDIKTLLARMGTEIQQVHQTATIVESEVWDADAP